MSSGKRKKINILVVEDSPTQAEHLKFILEKAWYKVSIASNGKEALSLLETTLPNLVISDIVMPEMDGYELCRTIKQDERFKQIPVILVTVLFDPQDVIRGLECGANNFIPKPYDEKYLLSRIEVVLASSYAGDTEKVQIGIDISFAGKKHHIAASRLQILNMLLSTYETAVQKNQELTEARDQLRELNENLEDLVAERTLQLETTNRQLIEEIEVRKKTEEALQRKTRAHQVISECIQFLIRTHVEQDLINGICNILVRSGGYRCAWVGYTHDDKNKTIEPVAQVGFEKEYLNNLQISWKTGRHGNGPTGKAIRTRNPIVIHDILNNPKCGSWISDAITRNYSAVVALPLNIKGQVIGALTIYAGDADAFDSDEMQLLSEMAGDLAFGISSIRTKIERNQAEAALQSSEEKFREIFNNVNDAIEIHEVLENGLPGKYFDFNDIACQMLQYTREEMFAISPLDITTEYYNRPITDIGEDLRTRGNARFETEHKRKDGTIIPVEINAHVVTLQGRILALAVVRDITERKQAENMLALVTRKLTLMNDVTYQYIQNKVTGLWGYAELSKDAKTEAERVSLIEKEEHTLADIHHLIKNTREYQEIGLLLPRWIPMEQSIRIAVSLVSPKPNISIETALHGLELYSDPIIEKIFANLIENVVKHGTTHTRITFSCEETPDELILICEDDGVGISPTDKACLFDRSVGQNIRFGLFFVRECLLLSGMTITETGTPGKGARFEMVVPKGQYRLSGKQ